MAVADYVTKEDLEDALKTLATKADIEDIKATMATKADIRAEANRVIEAIQRGTSANY
jgi:hypothetical protein